MARGTVAAPTSLPTNYVKPPYEPDKLTGRWPANLILDEVAAAELDRQSGTLTSGANTTRRSSQKTRNVYGEFTGQAECVAHRGTDTGGASRFFYTAKASRSERNAGLEGIDERKRDAGLHADQTSMNGGEGNPYNRGAKLVSNHHPTVKPLSLMRYLCRLITPPGGTVLDPFMGSGSTGCGAVQEGFDFVGIEREEEYLEIARRRIDHWRAQERLPV